MLVWYLLCQTELSQSGSAEGKHWVKVWDSPSMDFPTQLPGINLPSLSLSLSLKVVQSQYTLKVLHSLYSQSSAIQQLSKFYIPYTLKVVQSSSSQSVTFPIYIYILKVLHSLYFCDLSWTLPICIFLGALKVLSKCSHSALKMHFFPFTPFSSNLATQIQDFVQNAEATCTGQAEGPGNRTIPTVARRSSGVPHIYIQWHRYHSGACPAFIGNQIEKSISSWSSVLLTKKGSPKVPIPQINQR